MNWRVVAVLALSALLGGVCGGTLAGRLSPLWLRRTVVLLGIAVAIAVLVALALTADARSYTITSIIAR